MKEIFFAYMTYFDIKTREHKVHITEFTDDIEKAAYLLSKVNLKNKDVQYLDFCFDKVPNDLYHIFMNEKGLIPIYRSKDIDSTTYDNYQTLPLLFSGYYNQPEILNKKANSYLKNSEFNSVSFEEFEEIIDQSYIYLNTKSMDDFYGLEKFITGKETPFHSIITEYYSTLNNTSFDTNFNKDDNFDFIEYEEELMSKNNLNINNSDIENIFKKFFYHNHQEWYYLVEFIEKLNKRNDLYLAITTNSNVKATFDNNNKHHIFEFLNNILKDKNNTEIILILSQLTTISIDNNKIKIIAGAIFDKNGCQFLSKDNIKDAFQIDVENLPKDDDIVFYEFGKLLSKINILI